MKKIVPILSLFIRVLIFYFICILLTDSLKGSFANISDNSKIIISVFYTLILLSLSYLVYNVPKAYKKKFDSTYNKLFKIRTANFEEKNKYWLLVLLEFIVIIPMHILFNLFVIKTDLPAFKEEVFFYLLTYFFIIMPILYSNHRIVEYVFPYNKKMAYLINYFITACFWLFFFVYGFYITIPLAIIIILYIIASLFMGFFGP